MKLNFITFALAMLAVIEGNNKQEFVIAGAHYDHVSSYPGLIEGDCIFNGADDNASGTVGLMQIASAFAAMETRSCGKCVTNNNHIE